MGSNPPGYNSSYYEKNKDRLARLKAKRYREDPEYRAKAKEARARQLEREKMERRRAKEDPSGPVTKAQKPPKRMKITLPDGRVYGIPMLSVGQLAYRLGVSVQTVRKWEAEGILPETLYRTKGGHRLYTDDQAAAIEFVYKKHRGNAPPTGWRHTPEFVIELRRGLNELDHGIDTRRYVGLEGLVEADGSTDSEDDRDDEDY